DDALAIGRGRGRTIRIVVVRILLCGVGDRLLPKHFAIGAGQAHQRSLVFGLDGLRDEHLVAPDRRSGVSAVRQRRLPADVFGAAPTRGQVLLRASPLAVRPAPSRPVGGFCGEGSGQNRRHDGEWYGVEFHGADSSGPMEGRQVWSASLERRSYDRLRGYGSRLTHTNSFVSRTKSFPSA